MYDPTYHRASQSLDNVIDTFFIPILTGRNNVTEGESFLPSLHIQEALTFIHHEKLPLCLLILKKTTALLVAHILQQSFQPDNIHTKQQISKGRGEEIMKQQQFHQASQLQKTTLQIDRSQALSKVHLLVISYPIKKPYVRVPFRRTVHEL